MQYIPDLHSIFCPCCKKWYNILTEVYLPDGDAEEGSRVACLKCNWTLAFTWDIPEIFSPDYSAEKRRSTNG